MLPLYDNSDVRRGSHRHIWWKTGNCVFEAQLVGNFTIIFNCRRGIRQDELTRGRQVSFFQCKRIVKTTVHLERYMGDISLLFTQDQYKLIEIPIEVADMVLVFPVDTSDSEEETI
ncbi:hypothetical protein Glove_606g59 [Diversispora epigaea]|uniref:Uncharacterized protein n=1 Tax=Diversispora epigaea TaxID=1348612 RepID=A0A397G6U2_9GLOM|nr:hypothetical protein Glove_606g59 [Diversispora epigaea]